MKKNPLRITQRAGMTRTTRVGPLLFFKRPRSVILHRQITTWGLGGQNDQKLCYLRYWNWSHAARICQLSAGTSWESTLGDLPPHKYICLIFVRSSLRERRVIFVSRNSGVLMSHCSVPSFPGSDTQRVLPCATQPGCCQAWQAAGDRFAC